MECWMLSARPVTHLSPRYSVRSFPLPILEWSRTRPLSARLRAISPDGTWSTTDGSDKNFARRLRGRDARHVQRRAADHKGPAEADQGSRVGRAPARVRVPPRRDREPDRAARACVLAAQGN